MAGGIYLVQGDDLIPMTEQRYDSEEIIQQLIARHPQLLAGDQDDAATPRRWLLVRREMPVPGIQDGAGRWSVDHLFLDQDGVPTLVEVKRSTDTRIRREVVGQMLDYAANAVLYWPIDRLMEQFRATCEAAGREPDETLLEHLEADDDSEGFWQRVKTNLLAGHVRLVFLADQIPAELQRIVEFLNSQMDPAEVLAVEVRQYVGRGQRAVVPRLLGATQEAKTRKGAGTGSGSIARAKMDGSEYDAILLSVQPPEIVAVVERIRARATELGYRSSFERRRDFSACYLYLPTRVEGPIYRYWPFALQTDGQLQISFSALKNPDRAFANPERRRELQTRIERIPGVTLPPNAYLESRPTVPLTALRSAEALEMFFDVLVWFVSEVGVASDETSSVSPGNM